jgi:hypothetical protein
MDDADRERFLPARRLERSASVLISKSRRAGLTAEITGVGPQRVDVADRDSPRGARPTEPEERAPLPPRISLEDVLLEMAAVGRANSDQCAPTAADEFDGRGQMFHSHDTSSPT